MSTTPMDSGRTLTFACEDCGAAFEVDEPMRETLVAVGCVKCGASVSWSDFEAPSE